MVKQAKYIRDFIISPVLDPKPLIRIRRVVFLCPRLGLYNYYPFQNNLERSEYETKQRLNKQVEAVERERNILKRKLETEEKQAQTLTKHWEVCECRLCLL